MMTLPRLKSFRLPLYVVLAWSTCVVTAVTLACPTGASPARTAAINQGTQVSGIQGAPGKEPDAIFSQNLCSDPRGARQEIRPFRSPLARCA
jgi:hypothetical protein